MRLCKFESAGGGGGFRCTRCALTVAAPIVVPCAAQPLAPLLLEAVRRWAFFRFGFHVGRPRLVVRGVRFAKAQVRWARGGFALTIRRNFLARANACATCPSRQPSPFLGADLCAACGGCYLRIKRRMASESCPRRLWPGDPPGGCGGC